MTSCCSCALSTTPSHLYTDRTPGTTLTQAATPSSTISFASGPASNSAGTVHNANTISDMTLFSPCTWAENLLQLCPACTIPPTTARPPRRADRNGFDVRFGTGKTPDSYGGGW